MGNGFGVDGSRFAPPSTKLNLLDRTVTSTHLTTRRYVEQVQVVAPVSADPAIDPKLRVELIEVEPVRVRNLGGQERE